MRKTALSVLTVVAVTATVLTGAAVSQAAATHTGSYAYGTHQRQKLDAYWQDSKTPRAGLILIHGGTWNNGDKGGGWATAARWYADRGLAVFSINHRFNTEAAWPGPRDDVLSAINWIKGHATQFKLAPDKLVVMGSQAGGQLATSVGTYSTGSALVRGVIGLSAISSPYRSWGGAPDTRVSVLRRQVRDNAVLLARCHPSSSDTPCWNTWANTVTKTAASTGDAPMYLIHAQYDTTVSAGHDTDLANALKAKNIAVTVETSPGTASGGNILTDTYKNKTLNWIKALTAGTVQGVTSQVAPSPSPTPPSTPVTRRSTGDVDGARAAAAAIHENTDVPITESTHAYGAHSRQQLDAYYRNDGITRPALLIVHGGHWYEGDKKDWANTARWFTDRGYHVFSANYRYDTQAGWSAQRDDLRAAIAWIRAHSADFHIDPTRILAFGSSAGGHLVTTLGTYGYGSDLLRGAVALSPAADPYRAYNDGQAVGATGGKLKLRDNAVLLNRCTPDSANTSCWSRWKDSAARYRAGQRDTPVFLIHSQNEFVPHTHSNDLCTKLTANGVSCTLKTVAGDKHAGAILGLPGMYDEILAWLQAHD